MNITITGNLGSGKSTVCSRLKQNGFAVISGGDIFRQVAKEQNLSVVELNEKIKEEIKRGEHETDDRIDAKSARLGEELDQAVFDFRLGWHFVRDSFKIFLLTDIEEAAKRVFAADRETEKYGDVLECKAALLKRQKMEKERFAQLYQIDYYDMSNYNLIIDTTHASPDQVSRRILSEFADYREGKFLRHILLSPLSIRKTNPASDGFAQDAPEGMAACERDLENTESAAVCVTEENGAWYLLCGDGRIQTALRDGEAFLPVTIKNRQLPNAASTESADENLMDFSRCTDRM